MREAAALALERLRGARAAALRNKTCASPRLAASSITMAAPRPTRRPARSWVSTTTTTVRLFAAGGITTLLVCWLHRGASKADVQEIFERYGKVKEDTSTVHA